MQVFKTFMKILRTKSTAAVVYLVVFMVITVVMANAAKDSGEYEDYKMSVAVIDRDDTAESHKLQDFIFASNDRVELEDDTDQVTDAVYYERADYVLYINKGFAEKINAGEFDGLFENFKMPSSYDGQLFESRLDSYLSSVKAYMAAGKSADVAMELAKTAVSQQVKAQLKSFESGSQSDVPTIFGYYFQYLPYIFISMLVVTLCPVILALNRKNIRERTICSSLTLGEYSRQTAIGACVVVLGIWVIFTAAAAVITKTSGEKFWLASLNSFVFVIVAAGVALVIAQFDLSDNGVSAVSNIIGLGMSFLCGVFVPQDLLSKGVVAAGRLLPAYWYVKANNMLSGMCGEVFKSSEFFGCIIIEALFAAVLFAAAAVLMRVKRRGADHL